MALALKGMYSMYLLITHASGGANGEALVHSYLCKTEWNRTNASVHDPFSISGMSVSYQ